MKKHLLIAITLGVFILNTQAHNIPSENLSVIINIAGKQQMITQRIGKALLYKVLDAETQQAEKDLQIGITSFEENLKTLKDFSQGNSELEGSLTIVETEWIMYKKIAKGEVTTSNAKFVYDQSGLILKSCELYLERLVNYIKVLPSSTKSKNAIENISEKFLIIASQERILSQKLCMQYAAILLGITENEKSFLQNFNDFSENITKLEGATGDNGEVDDAMSEVLVIWKEIRANKDNFITKSYPSNKLYELTSSLLVKLDKVTSIYAKI